MNSPATTTMLTVVMRASIAIGLCCGLFMSSGCTARRVLREPDYGIIAIPYNSNSWPSRLRNQADELMTEHFPQGYKIVKEEEYIVGQTTHVNHENNGTNVEIIDDILSVGTSSGQVTETTTPKTEYRIHYVPAGTGP